MKAELDAQGRLIVTAETDLESFALRCWWEKVPTGAASATVSPYILVRPVKGGVMSV